MSAPRPEYDLQRQRAWLLLHFRSDRDLVGDTLEAAGPLNRFRKPMCRCWCCGKLLGERALFVNKVDPNGTTRRSNIRPACADHAA
jgi:hypothetical protein